MISVCGKHEAFAPVQPMKCLQREIDFHSARDIQESARPRLGLVQRGEFLTAKNRFLAHEMLPNQIRMLGGRLFQRKPDHALLTAGDSETGSCERS